jgi:hypothetical protein
MQYQIDKLYKNSVNTKEGPKDIYKFTTKQKPGVYISCWVGNWNRDWAQGRMINIEKDQIKKTEKNGKTYLNLSAPAEARFQGVSRQEFEALVARVDALESRLDDVEANSSDESGEGDFLEPDPADESQDEFVADTSDTRKEEINPADIPF